MYRFYKSYRGILQDERLTRTQKVILAILINRAEYYKGNKFYCFESWIASEADCSEKTVKRAVKHFESLGLIAITPTYNKTTKKKTNFYVVNFDWSKGKMVEETGADGTAVEQQEVAQNSVTPIIEAQEVKLSAIEPEYTYNEIVATDEDIDITKCKVVTPMTAVEISNDVLNNVFTYLKSNANEAKKGMVYFPAVKSKYGYDYKTVVESVRALANKGYINYDPQEKDGKLFHFYTISSSVVTDEKKFEETLGKWIDLCSNQMSRLNADSTEDEKKLVLSTLSNYAAAYMTNGVTKDDLKNAIQYVYNNMIV